MCGLPWTAQQLIGALSLHFHSWRTQVGRRLAVNKVAFQAGSAFLLRGADICSQRYTYC